MFKIPRHISISSHHSTAPSVSFIFVFLFHPNGTIKECFILQFNFSLLRGALYLKTYKSYSEKYQLFYDISDTIKLSYLKEKFEVLFIYILPLYPVSCHERSKRTWCSPNVHMFSVFVVYLSFKCGNSMWNHEACLYNTCSFEILICTLNATN